MRQSFREDFLFARLLWFAFLVIAINWWIISVLGGGRFFDPRTKQSFKYDHLRKEASDFQNFEPDSIAEPWRSALDVEAIQYTANHYRHGVCSVFGRNDPSTNQITLSLCIEDHQFQPHNYWNGRWRSQWSFTFSSSGSGAAEAKGVLKVQVRTI